jgi:hypothetical protein
MMTPLSLFQLLVQDTGAPEEPVVHPSGISARVIILSIMVALPVVRIIMVLVGGMRLKSMLGRVKKINGKNDLEILRKESKVQGTMALAMKPMMGITPLLFVVDLFFLHGPVTDLAYAVIPSLISIAVALPMRKFEQQVRNLPCASEDLRQEWVQIMRG